MNVLIESLSLLGKIPEALEVLKKRESSYLVNLFNCYKPASAVGVHLLLADKDCFSCKCHDQLTQKCDQIFGLLLVADLVITNCLLMTFQGRMAGSMKTASGS